MWSSSLASGNRGLLKCHRSERVMPQYIFPLVCGTPVTEQSHKKEICWFVFWRNPLNWSKWTAQSPVLFSPRSFKQVSLSQNRHLLYLFADGVQMWHCMTEACQSSWNRFKGESSQQQTCYYSPFFFCVPVWSMPRSISHPLWTSLSQWGLAHHPSQCQILCLILAAPSSGRSQPRSASLFYPPVHVSWRGTIFIMFLGTYCTTS